MFERLRKSLRENRRLWIVIAVALLTSLFIAWGAFTGFSFGLNRFFAAAPTVCTFANKAAPECACALNRSTTSACHVCTRSFQEGNTDYSDGQWFAWDNAGWCRPSCPASFPYETERTRRNGDRFPLPQGCVEKPADCPDGYFALTIPDGRTICEQSAPPVTPTPTPATGAAVLSVQCGAVQNVLTWTLVPGRDSNSVLRNVDGADATYICGGPNGLPPCNDLNIATYTDTVQAGHTYTYAHKSCADSTCRSNSVTCSAVTTTPTPTATTNPVLTPTPTATSCASLYPPVAKCYGIHACQNHSSAQCEASDTANEISTGVYFGFEDIYKAPDGTVYWFNWRSKSPPENDPTKWTWAKIPANPQAWCGPASGIVSVAAPTTDLHAIFDAQAKAGRFGCAVGEVGAYNNSKQPPGQNIDCPAAEKAYYTCRASLAVATTTPAPTVPSSPPPPTAGTLTCSPQQQTITVGGMTEHSAQGGDGVNYRWEVSPGAVKQDGVSNFVIYSWLTTGVKSVTVTSGGDQATCTVNVQDSAGAAVTLTASKEVRNVTAGQITFTPSTSVWKNQAIEFSLRIAPTSGAQSGPYLVTDMLPSGMTYMAGSTLLNGGPFDDPTQTAGGLVFRPFPVDLGTAATLEYRAMSDRFEVDLSPPESRAVEMTAVDQGSGSDARAAVTLTLYGRGPATAAAPGPGGPGTIPTGPGDAVTFALIAAAVSSLLYAAYTRSAAFRSREVRRIERDQGPMDFRS